MRQAPIIVPCGWCRGCRARKAQDWAVRAVHEAQLNPRSCFITLTFADDQLPSGLSVDVRDWQLFAKRVRKKMGPFRFLACGEYGDRNLRPHYHACLFGIDFSEDRKLHSEKRGYRLWRSPTLEKLWPHGFSTIGQLNWETAAYTSRYVMKKVHGRGAATSTRYRRETQGQQWFVKPEFVVASRRRENGRPGGLGAEWFERFHADVYPCDFVVVNGRKLPPPRYYDTLMSQIDGELMEAVKTEREIRAIKKHHEQREGRRPPEHVENEVRERVAARKLRRELRDAG